MGRLCERQPPMLRHQQLEVVPRDSRWRQLVWEMQKSSSMPRQAAKSATEFPILISDRDRIVLDCFLVIESKRVLNKLYHLLKELHIKLMCVCHTGTVLCPIISVSACWCLKDQKGNENISWCILIHISIRTCILKCMEHQQLLRHFRTCPKINPTWLFFFKLKTILVKKRNVGGKLDWKNALLFFLSGPQNQCMLFLT